MKRTVEPLKQPFVAKMRNYAPTVLTISHILYRECSYKCSQTIKEYFTYAYFTYAVCSQAPRNANRTFWLISDWNNSERPVALWLKNTQLQKIFWDRVPNVYVTLRLWRSSTNISPTQPLNAFSIVRFKILILITAFLYLENSKKIKIVFCKWASML